MGRIQNDTLNFVEQVTTYNWKEAYPCAGALYSSLNTDEDVKEIDIHLRDELKAKLKQYYSLNDEINALQKRIVAIAYSMSDLVK